MSELRLCRRIFLAMSLVLLAAPCIAGAKHKPTDAYIHGTVLSDGLPIRGAEIWIFNIDHTSNKFHVIEEVKTDKYGIYGTMPLSQGRYLVEVELPKALDKKQSRNIRRVITISENNAVTLDIDFSIRWREASNFKKEFLAFVNGLLASAREERPMGSIRWASFGDKSIWIPNFMLPGADSCTISIFTSLELNGTNLALPIFQCTTEYATHDAAESGYRSLVQFIIEVTGWKASSNSTSMKTSFKIVHLLPFDEVTVAIINQTKIKFSYTTFKRSPGFRLTLIQHSDKFGHK
jgi:hypothetical protein